jgi:hypothetical protein
MIMKYMNITVQIKKLSTTEIKSKKESQLVSATAVASRAAEAEATPSASSRMRRISDPAVARAAGV